MLALIFNDESDYEKILEDDTFNFIDLNEFAPGKPVLLEIVHSDGGNDVISLNHSYNEQQIQWFKEGSALNMIRKEINN
jgi:aconitate hydratase